MKVRFTFSKSDDSLIKLDYTPFDKPHSKLWVQSISDFIDSGNQLKDVNRVYNFNNYLTEFKTAIENCNNVITDLNNVHNMNISPIRENSWQEDINKAHTFFAETNRQTNLDHLWVKLNEYLHGLEIVQRSKNKNLQGQVFCCLGSTKYNLPEESYLDFTTRKHFGYCYANYPHIGRHIFEMYNARDEDADDEDVIPMSKVAGDFYLWFGNTTAWPYDKLRMLDIRKWFYKNNIQDIVKMQWGDPKLAIGWLPVAEIDQKISKDNLAGLRRLEHIEII